MKYEVTLYFVSGLKDKILFPEQEMKTVLDSLKKDWKGTICMCKTMWAHFDKVTHFTIEEKQD